MEVYGGILRITKPPSSASETENVDERIGNRSMSERLRVGEKGYFETLQKLRPVSGCCVMIDFVGSTELKEKLEDKEWIRLYLHTFDWIKGYIGIANHSKIVGDSMMFWFRNFGDLWESRAHLFQGLIDMQQWNIEGAPLPLRAAVTLCQSVYEITFDVSTNLDLPIKDSPPQPDVYGKEIDLTHRLMSLAGEREIFMNKWLYQNLAFSHRDRPDSLPWFHQIEGPWSFQIKGLSEDVTAYNYRVPKPS